ncbi:Protein PIN-LIKES 3 [Dichanthelium oligosanthes]|uniref:Protein PIN-LIKES 3 n=1 Tax=Dichanthelium oligosanthes TaxID=888268 RepID=A0A1E5UVT1_9POAL|nr:Protein PIN-LIKES 3 [Dichanthelium oligosanthes]
MGLLELFVTACVPVVNMLLVTSVGSFLASDFAGILTKEARKHLNNLVFYLFNPSLIATYLAKTITIESLGKLWFMPVNVLLSFIFGLFFGWIVVQVTRPPARLNGLILGCCSAGNVGNIFLIIIPALCKEKGSPFGAPDACKTYGLAYSSLSLAIGAVFLWSIAYNIIRVTSQVSEGDGDARTNQPTVLISSATEPVSEEKCSTSNTNECKLPLISTDIPPNKSKVPLSERARQFLSSIAGGLDFKKLFAPSTIAVIVGLILGATPLIKNVIIGENAPLRALQESAQLIGGAAVPAVTLIMGGNLLKGVRGRASVQPSVIAGVIVVRYILLPLLGTVLVNGAVRLGLVQPDPLYQFILLLQHAVPPAMNIGTMTQLFGVGESECSVIFVWAYALASVAVTAWSAFFLWTLSP